MAEYRYRSLLPRCCKVLHFSVDVTIQDDDEIALYYVNEMSIRSTDLEDVTPLHMYSHKHDIYYIFKPCYYEDRTYEISIYRRD